MSTTDQSRLTRRQVLATTAGLVAITPVMRATAVLQPEHQGHKPQTTPTTPPPPAQPAQGHQGHAPVAAAAAPGNLPYCPVIAPDSQTLPFEMDNGVKVFRLTAEPVAREFAPGLVVNCWGYNGQSPGPMIEAVEGDVEALCTCPCCDFRTLSTRGGYEICPVCQWEDDGGREPDRLSSPNHMTLREGRSNFARFGASSERATLHVPSDGNERYERG